MTVGKILGWATLALMIVLGLGWISSPVSWGLDGRAS